MFTMLIFQEGCRRMNTEPQRLVELEPAEVEARLRAGTAVLVDVREAHEFADERITGAVSLPMSEFEAEALPATPGKTAILMCLGGMRSAAVAEMLLDGGHAPVIHLKGGLQAWKDAGLPTLSE